MMQDVRPSQLGSNDAREVELGALQDEKPTATTAKVNVYGLYTV